MPLGLYCRRSVCTTSRDETIRAAAERMEKEGVGMLVVVEEDRPIAVLTDRDVALHGRGESRVAEAMSAPPATIRADASIADATARMGSRGVRRLPVVDADGRLFGLLSADDVLRLVASQIGGLAAVAAAQLPPEPEPEAEATAPGAGSKPPVSHYVGEVGSVRADVPVSAAIAKMREHAAGCVVVTGEAEEPVGLLTDRDVALRVVARGADCGTTPVSAVMSSPPVSCDASAPLEAVVEQMRSHGVRRMPIVRDRRLAGMVTFDDLVAAFGDELHRLGEAARRQVRREGRRVQAERVREEVGEKLQEAATRLSQIGGEAMTALGREVKALAEKFRRGRD